MNYNIHHTVLGTILFSIFIFLFPTIWIYYLLIQGIYLLIYKLLLPCLVLIIQLASYNPIIWLLSIFYNQNYATKYGRYHLYYHVNDHHLFISIHYTILSIPYHFKKKKKKKKKKKFKKCLFKKLLRVCLLFIFIINHIHMKYFLS